MIDGLRGEQELTILSCPKTNPPQLFNSKMSKSMYLKALFVLSIVPIGVASASAATSLPIAITSTNLIASSTIVLGDRAELFATTFGLHQVVSPSGKASAQATVGADTDGVPFIAFAAAASGQNVSLVTSQLDYYWSINGPAGELVPVTITTLGNIWGRVTATSPQPNLSVTAPLGSLQARINSRFDTWSVGGRQDFRSYGVGGLSFQDPGPSLPGGSVTATGAGSFSQTFTLMVFPNAGNRIIMNIGGQPNSDLYQQHSNYSWAFGGYIDPIITIDPAFADRFSLVQSSIPTVAVPEVSTLAMMLGGFGLLVWKANRRRTTGY